MNARMLTLVVALAAGVTVYADDPVIVIDPPVIVGPCPDGPCVHTPIRVVSSMGEGVDFVGGSLLSASLDYLHDDDVTFFQVSVLPPLYDMDMMPEDVYATFFTSPRDFPNMLNPGPLYTNTDVDPNDPNHVTAYEISGNWWDESIDPGVEFTMLQLTLNQPMMRAPLTLTDTGVDVLTVVLTITTQELGQPPVTSDPVTLHVYRETSTGPYNDDCSNAIEVYEGETLFTTYGATTDGPSEPDDCSWLGDPNIPSDIWFRYTATYDGSLIVTLCGSEYDTELAVYDATCPIGPGEVLACNDDDCGLQSEVILPVVAGQEYLIRIGGYLGDQGTGVLTLLYSSPGNDECQNALPVWDEDLVPGTLVGATNDGSASCGYSSANPDVWYTFTAPQDGVLHVSTCGTHDGPGVDLGMDAVLSLHSGCPGTSGNEIACNDDWPAGSDPTVCAGTDAGEPRDAGLAETMAEGQTVLIRVSHYGSSMADGQFVLHVDFGPPNDVSPHVAGDFQGWDPTSDPMTETSPGSNIWERTYAGLAPGSRHEFKITNGLPWDDPNHVSWPIYNSWCFADSTGEVLITYDGNVYGDGRFPVTHRLPLPDYCDPGTWTAVGDFQGWDPSNPQTGMWPYGDDAYTYVCTGLAPGTHYWKAAITGTWDSISWDARSVSTADMPFEINSETDILFLEVYPLEGTVRLETRVGGACCFWDEHCEITEPDECVYMGGDYQGDNVPCSPGLCEYHCSGDVDGDGDTDLSDLAALLGSYGDCVGDPNFNAGADFDNDGCVTLSDLAHLLGDYSCGN